jgi:hypothetical protein
MVDLEGEFDKYKGLLTEQGRAAMSRSFTDYRQQYGAEWLAKWKERNPGYTLIVDLCANHGPTEAFEGLGKYVQELIDEEAGVSIQGTLMKAAATVFLSGAENDVRKIHALIRDAIDKPRF